MNLKIYSSIYGRRYYMWTNIDPMIACCQKILPLVYDDSLSYYETVCKVVAKLNEVVKATNDIPDYIASLITEEGLKDILASLLSNLEEQIAQANEGVSKTATANRHVGELVWLNGDLYKITKNMNAGDRYVDGSNCAKTTIENVISEESEKRKAYEVKTDESVEALQTGLDAERSQRTAADNNFTTLLNSEVANRKSGDDNLQTEINKLNEKLGVLEYLPIIDVTNHGVVGDGTTDNTDAINALLQNGGNIYFPEGTYYCAGKLDVGEQYTRIQGAGRNTVILFNGDGFNVTNFYVEICDLTLNTNKKGGYGISANRSYCKFHDLWFYDSADSYFNNFIIGSAGSPVWFDIIENIFINDSNATTTNGTAFDMTSTVNNLINNVIIHGKNVGFNFNKDKSAGYATDGCQINNSNITTCNIGVTLEGCSAVYFNNTIFDQIIALVFNYISASHCYFNSCYLSGGGNSISDFVIGRITDSANVTLMGCECAGNLSVFGFVLSNCTNVTIIDGSINHVTSGITITDDKTKDCYFGNIYFNEHVATKLYVNGERNIYSNLKGKGTIEIAGQKSFHCVSMFATGSGTATGTGDFYLDIDIPLPAGIEKPSYIGFSIMDGDANFVSAILYSNSPAGYIRVRVRKTNNTQFTDTIKYTYMLPIIQTQ